MNVYTRLCIKLCSIIYAWHLFDLCRQT